MEKVDLPEGWEWKPIRRVVQPKDTWSYKKDSRKSFLYVDISSIDNSSGTIILDDVKSIDGLFAPSRAKKIIRKGDVIFATTRPYLKNIAIVPTFLDNNICSTGFCVLRPIQTEVLTEWLYYIARSDFIVDQVIPNQEKSTYPAVSDDEVLDSEIPIPPLDDQRRIVARIEELTSRVEEARRLRREAVGEVTSLSRRSGKKYFNNENGTRKLSELTKRITKGESPRWQGFSYQDTGPFFVRSENVLWGTIDTSYGNHIPDEFHKQLIRSQLKGGDVLINLVGASIGRTCIVPDSFGEANVNQAVAVITTDETLLDNKYLLHYILSPDGQETLKSGEVQSAQPNISLRDLQKLDIPLPSLDEQKEIVKHLDSLQSKVEQLKKLQYETEEELERFVPALLAKAFKGEL